MNKNNIAWTHRHSLHFCSKISDFQDVVDDDDNTDDIINYNNVNFFSEIQLYGIESDQSPS